MSGITLYGLKTCDTCRKALTALAGREVTFVDVRTQGIPRDLLAAWVARLGPAALVNRQSTTWRGFDEATRARAETPDGALALLADHPALMKRPVIVAGDAVHVGWAPATRAAIGI